MKKASLFAAMALSALFVSAPILAHHGETNYDTEKLVTVKATVTKFEFINPHTQITLDAKNDMGEVEIWVCEARKPGHAGAQWRLGQDYYPSFRAEP